MAEELLETYLEAPVKTLLALCAAASGEGSNAGEGKVGEERKQHIRLQLLMLEGALGARSSLADLAAPKQAAACPWSLVGAVGVAVGREGARERVGEALHALIATVRLPGLANILRFLSALLSCGQSTRCLRSQRATRPRLGLTEKYPEEKRVWLLPQEPAGDPETLQLVMRVLDSVMGCGRREFSDWQQSLSAWRVDAHYLTQPKLAVLAPTAAAEDTDGAQPMHEGEGHGAALAARRGAAWRGRCLKARPRWLVVERAYLTGQWRASQVSDPDPDPERSYPF